MRDDSKPASPKAASPTSTGGAMRITSPALGASGIPVPDGNRGTSLAATTNTVETQRVAVLGPEHVNTLHGRTKDPMEVDDKPGLEGANGSNGADEGISVGLHGVRIDNDGDVKMDE